MLTITTNEYIFNNYIATLYKFTKLTKKQIKDYMSSFQYKLTEFLFRHTVRPMMKRAAMYPEKFIEKRRKTEQKKRLPLPSLHKKYDFDEQSVGGTPYYAIHSRYKSGERLVLYFFGGGFVMSGDSGDFEFAQEMADRTGADVWLVWHKLLPEVTDKEIIESVITVYQEALQRYKAEDITFFGLSSGGSLCLDVCVYINEQTKAIPLPGKLIPVSATIQMPPTKKQSKTMMKIGKKDVMFTPDYVMASAKMMSLCGSGGLLGNAIAHSWRGFPKIMAVYGSHEIYYAQMDDFKRKCVEDKVDLKTYVGEGMMHTWVAAGWLPEAKQARDNIYSYIKEKD